MKRFASVLGIFAWLLSAAVAFGAETSVTPPIGSETGQESRFQAMIVDMARIKLGHGTLSLTVSASAAAGTLNTASGKITLATATAGASGATPTTVTLTNSKAFAASLVMCGIDFTGATAGAVPTCSAAPAAGSIVFTISNGSSTALLSSTIVLSYILITSGNPN